MQISCAEVIKHLWTPVVTIPSYVLLTLTQVVSSSAIA